MSLAPGSGIRVLHILHNLRGGGAQRRVAELVAFARQHGEDWMIAYLSEPSSQLMPYLERNGIPVVGPLSGSFRSPRNVTKLLQLVNELKPDLLNAHTTWPGFWAAKLHGRFSGPIVYTEHSVSSSPGFVGRVKFWIHAKLTFHGVDWIVCVSEALARAVRRVAPAVAHKTSVVYNGLDTRSLQVTKSRREVRRELSVADDQPLICAVGHIVQIKRYEVPIRAMASVCRDFPTAVLLIAGEVRDKALFQRLQGLAVQMGVQDNVAFLGMRHDVPDLLSAADVFVMSSHLEGLPGALVEAAFIGCPVVASAVWGIPEIIEAEQSGILVPPGDPEAFASGIKRLLSDPDLARRLAQRAQEDVRRRFTMEAMYEGYRQLYERLCSTHSP
ncbi:MAG: glycosyltransferase family 4 protein [Armatimonadetes bacterium]|nr:glycosyltransferase family 4 protein [Armatimonadota bacterium]